MGGAYDVGTVFQLAQGMNGTWTGPYYITLPRAGRCRGTPCGVIFDASGNLYGTTQAGGAIGAYGTVFELMPGANGDLRPGRKFVRDNQ